MKTIISSLLLACVFCLPVSAAGTGVLAVDPANPHYFTWRGKSTVLVTSGEHYGAVMNRPFDCVKYLNTLQADGLNNTRLFMGLYVEDNGDGAAQAGNVLDPGTELICPFARSNVPGYAGGGNKFDLSQWDAEFFTRLKDYVAQASARGVTVEINLFCPFYDNRFRQWDLTPFNAKNNIQGLGASAMFTHRMESPLLPYQEAMVRKIVTELNAFDNIYFEIINEPYGQEVYPNWENHITDVIVATESTLPNRHLISRNVDSGQLGTTPIDNVYAPVSIFNFHYAKPNVISLNWGLNKIIGDNETGFKGTEDAGYRREGWDFLLSGGALYNNLDYSFTVGHEDGTFVNPGGQWGGGSAALRTQLKYLKKFMDSFDFVKMVPNNAVVTSSPDGMTPRALVESGKQYAVYLGPNGEFSVRWTGFVTAPTSGTYTFSTITEGSVRLWVNNTQIINNPTFHTQATDNGTIFLSAGQKVPIKMEYWIAKGYASAKLHWTRPGSSDVAIENFYLSPPSGSGTGLQGDYFAGVNFSRLKETRTEYIVDYYWSINLPYVSTSEPAADLGLNLPAGSYLAEWIGTMSGNIEKSESFQHAGGNRTLAAPAHQGEIALRLKNTGGTTLPSAPVISSSLTATATVGASFREEMGSRTSIPMKNAE